MDFKAPSINQIGEFLLSLFQEKNLQPSTIDGYKTAIADKVGNSSVGISKDENFTHLLDSCNKVRPKGHRGILAWNLSLLLHQLAKTSHLQDCLHSDSDIRKTEVKSMSG